MCTRTVAVGAIVVVLSCAWAIAQADRAAHNLFPFKTKSPFSL
jgi:hypothetical protein